MESFCLSDSFSLQGNPSDDSMTKLMYYTEDNEEFGDPESALGNRDR